MSDHNRNGLIDWALKLYIVLAFVFIFAPIAASFVWATWPPAVTGASPATTCVPCTPCFSSPLPGTT